MKVVIPSYESPANQFLYVRSDLLLSRAGPAFNLWEALAFFPDEYFPLELPNGEIITLCAAITVGKEFLCQHDGINEVFLRLQYEVQFWALKRIRDAGLELDLPIGSSGIKKVLRRARKNPFWTTRTNAFEFPRQWIS